MTGIEDVECAVVTVEDAAGEDIQVRFVHPAARQGFTPILEVDEVAGRQVEPGGALAVCLGVTVVFQVEKVVDAFPIKGDKVCCHPVRWMEENAGFAHG